MITRIGAQDMLELKLAHALLENPGLAARITNLVGAPLELGLDRLPEAWRGKIADATRLALTRAVDAAVFTMNGKPARHSANLLHKVGAAAAGGVGGFFGLAGLAVELPVSTTIMMRSIADIARSQGESPADADTRMACLTVFALGGRSGADDGAESGYYLVRGALAKAVSQAAEYAAGGAAAQGMAAPALMRLITMVADRFGIQVTEKIAAQAVPALGAAGGAVINTLFIDHFQDMATGHFTVRRLERRYGHDAVQEAYRALGRPGDA